MTNYPVEFSQNPRADYPIDGECAGGEIFSGTKFKISRGRRGGGKVGEEGERGGKGRECRRDRGIIIPGTMCPGR